MNTQRKPIGHRSLIPLGSCDGHYQDPQRGGRGGGEGPDLIPLGKKNPKTKRNKEKSDFWLHFWFVLLRDSTAARQPRRR